jgi:hypothetical protein
MGHLIVLSIDTQSSWLLEELNSIGVVRLGQPLFGWWRVGILFEFDNKQPGCRHNGVLYVTIYFLINTFLFLIDTLYLLILSF